MIYFASLDNKIYALDELSQKELWTYQITGVPASNNASISIADGIVYANIGGLNATSGSLIALNASTGTELWSKSKLFFSSVIANGILYVTSDILADKSIMGNISAYDAKTGTELWTSEMKHSTFGVLSIASGAIYVSTDSNLYTYHLPNTVP